MSSLYIFISLPSSHLLAFALLAFQFKWTFLISLTLIPIYYFLVVSFTVSMFLCLFAQTLVKTISNVFRKVSAGSSCLGFIGKTLPGPICHISNQHFFAELAICNRFTYKITEFSKLFKLVTYSKRYWGQWVTMYLPK